jgi:hypothetical protein
VRVSIGAAGYEAGANTNSSAIPNQSYAQVSAPAEAGTWLAVSADGSRVLFSSRGALTEGAEAAAAEKAESVYEYDSIGSIDNGSVYLISDGTNMLNALEIGLDASGKDAFFQTADPLIPSDIDTAFDIYDARIDGGFPAPAAPVACEGDPCQGSPSAPPPLGAPGSVSELGGGNLAAPVEGKPKPTKHKHKHKLKKRRRKAKGIHKPSANVKGHR